MKILLIDVHYKNSSTGKIVYDLYSSLRKKGETVSVCYGRGPLSQEPDVYKFGLDWETNIHGALARLTGYNGCFSFFSTRQLLNYLDQFQPDLIHIHELHAYFVNLNSLIQYIKKKRIPVVWTFHCEYMYTGKCGYAYECEGFLKECGNCPSVRDYPKSLWFDRTKKMFRMKKELLRDLNFTIVTPSQWLADRVKMSYLNEKPLKVIHNGIDTESTFYPRNSEETNYLKVCNSLDDRPIVLSVAPDIMNERKGGKEILKVAEIMKDLQFVLVGTGETKKFSDNVLLIHRTKNQDELARWYSLADLFLICSKKENFPTTCIESLCCGTPIVGIDAGGTKETAPYPYGKFVKFNTLLPKEIENQLNAKIPRDAIREKAVELFSKEVMCDSYEKLYYDCCES